MKKIITLLSILTIPSLNAFTFISNPTFTGGTLTTGTTATVDGNDNVITTTSGPTVITYTNVGSVDVNGTATQVNATFTVDSVTGFPDVRFQLNQNALGFQIRPVTSTPAGLLDPHVTANIAFTFVDGTATPISGLFVNFLDLDSSGLDISDQGGVAVGQFSEAQVAGTTDVATNVLTSASNLILSDAISGFNTGQLPESLHTTGGVGNNNTAEEIAAVQIEFALNERSDFDVVFGITGAESNIGSNRGITANFSNTSIFPEPIVIFVPEPSVFALLGLSSIALLLRRKR